MPEGLNVEVANRLTEEEAERRNNAGKKLLRSSRCCPRATRDRDPWSGFRHRSGMTAGVRGESLSAAGTVVEGDGGGEHRRFAVLRCCTSPVGGVP